MRERIVSIDQAKVYPEATAAQVDTLKAQALLTEAAIHRYDTWQKAFEAYKAKNAAAETAASYLTALDQVVVTVGPNEAPAARALREDQAKVVQSLESERIAARNAVCAAVVELERHHAVVMAMQLPLVPAPLPTDRERARVVALANCIEGIENPSVSVNFSDCLLPNQQTAQATDVPVAERPLRPRGFTAAFSGSQTDTKVSLQFANEFKLRDPRNDGGQRYSTWGFSTGLVASDSGFGDFDDDGKRNNKRYDKDLDRINAKVKLTGSLSFNSYPVEPAADWQARALEVSDSTYKACLKDRADTGSAESCAGEDLKDWLVATKADGSYKHKTEMEAYSNLYFGPAKATMNAEWGALLNGEIARPSFTYKIAGIEETARRTNWSFGGALYRRWTLAPLVDFTGVLSLTYKKDWRDYFASDETLDKTRQPVLHKGLVPAAEGRFLFRGWSWIPATAFFPKYSMDRGSERESVDIPVLFLFGEKLSSAAGFKWTRAWGGDYDDGIARPATSELSLVYQKTFSINPDW